MGINSRKPKWGLATACSILTGVPLSYGLDTGWNLTEMLFMPATIGLYAFPRIWPRLGGIAYCYAIALPSTFLVALLFMRSWTHPGG